MSHVLKYSNFNMFLIFFHVVVDVIMKSKSIEIELRKAS
jgi:hypothetical protein